MEGLLVLRKVRPLTQGAFEYGYEQEGDKSYFPAFVDNDLPRDDAITQELMEKTQGFAVATSDGEVLAKFRSVAEAEQARDTAKPSFNVNIEMPEKGDDTLDFDDDESDDAA